MSFHVPELARILDHPQLWSTRDDGNNGAFQVPSVDPGWTLFFICSDSTQMDAVGYERWEHVSVQACVRNRSRVPTWKEMCQIKDICWDDEDVVMQLHPRRSQYINQHPSVLHLWRPIDATIPEPPSIFVGEHSKETV